MSRIAAIDLHDGPNIALVLDVLRFIDYQMGSLSNWPDLRQPLISRVEIPGVAKRGLFFSG